MLYIVNTNILLANCILLGMLDLIRIRREGYPVHIDFEAFISSYKCLCKGIRFPNVSSKEIVQMIFKALNYPTNQWQVWNFVSLLFYLSYDKLQC